MAITKTVEVTLKNGDKQTFCLGPYMHVVELNDGGLQIESSPNHVIAEFRPGEWIAWRPVA